MSWLRKSKPLCFLFLAVRVVDERDLGKTVEFALAATRMMDDVGMIAYRPDAANSGYQLQQVPMALELDRVLSRLATALRDLPAARS